MLKNKKNFLQTKAWKEFRDKLIKVKKIDFITHKRLRQLCSVHHCDMSSKNYKDLTNDDNFVVVNNDTHEMIHWLWNFYRFDEGVIERLKEVMEKMKKLNNNEVDYQFEENKI